MNRPTQRRSMLLIFAVCFAAAATAVQAEPKTREQVAAELRQAKAAGLVTHGEQDYPPQVYQPSSKTRAEVRADLRLWTRAGLADLHRGELEPDVFGLDYRTRYAGYVRMRTGPEYQQALELELGLSNAPPMQPRMAAAPLSACDAPPERVAAYRDMQDKGMKTRAEVRADTLIWKRAGMDDLFRGRQRLDTTNPKYRERYADYVRMRSGQEYTAELCRQLGAAG